MESEHEVRSEVMKLLQQLQIVFVAGVSLLNMAAGAIWIVATPTRLEGIASILVSLLFMAWAILEAYVLGLESK
jgi:hypothetical protein